MIIITGERIVLERAEVGDERGVIFSNAPAISDSDGPSGVFNIFISDNRLKKLGPDSLTLIVTSDTDVDEAGSLAPAFSLGTDDGHGRYAFANVSDEDIEIDEDDDEDEDEQWQFYAYISSDSTESSHKIELNLYGDLRCDCPAWKYSKESPKSCKHCIRARTINKY